MKAKTTTQKSGSISRITTKVDDQVYTTGLAVIGLSAGIIGLWAVACIIGGMIASGGPIALVSNWVRAITG